MSVTMLVGASGAARPEAVSENTPRSSDDGKGFGSVLAKAMSPSAGHHSKTETRGAEDGEQVSPAPARPRGRARHGAAGDIAVTEQPGTGPAPDAVAATGQLASLPAVVSGTPHPAPSLAAASQPAEDDPAGAASIAAAGSPRPGLPESPDAAPRQHPPESLMGTPPSAAAAAPQPRPEPTRAVPDSKLAGAQAATPSPRPSAAASARPVRAAAAMPRTTQPTPSAPMSPVAPTPTPVPPAPAPATPAATAAAPPSAVPTAQPTLEAALTRLRTGPSGTHELTVQLHPADLGAVRVVARLSGEHLDVTVLCADPAAHQAVAAAVPALHERLSDLGHFDIRAGFAGPASDQPGSTGAGAHGRPQGGAERQPPPLTGDGPHRPTRPDHPARTGTRRAAADARFDRRV